MTYALMKSQRASSGSAQTDCPEETQPTEEQPEPAQEHGPAPETAQTPGIVQAPEPVPVQEPMPVPEQQEPAQEHAEEQPPAKRARTSVIDLLQLRQDWEYMLDQRADAQAYSEDSEFHRLRWQFWEHVTQQADHFFMEQQIRRDG